MHLATVKNSWKNASTLKSISSVFWKLGESDSVWLLRETAEYIRILDIYQVKQAISRCPSKWPYNLKMRYSILLTKNRSVSPLFRSFLLKNPVVWKSIFLMLNLQELRYFFTKNNLIKRVIEIPIFISSTFTD